MTHILSFFDKAYQGKTFSLAKHYWLFLVFPNVLFMILWIILGYHSLDFKPSHLDFLYGAFSVIQWGLFLAAYIGLFRCALNKGQGKLKGWGRIAVAAASIGLLSGIINSYHQLSNTPSTNLSKDLCLEIDQINSQLPRKVDNSTTLVRANYNGNTLIYTYEVDASLYNNNWSPVKAQKIITQNMCSYFGKYLADPALELIKLIYKIPGKDDFILQVRQTDCNT